MTDDQARLIGLNAYRGATNIGRLIVVAIIMCIGAAFLMHGGTFFIFAGATIFAVGTLLMAVFLTLL